ncbi:hypothetical protein BDQ12DRAFT_677362 [Crucibulum laeve]|uniref:Uncharacterized protein n=1 Tax=Crucibulum laeve TaxID=68775 RepID=A0A5C3MAI4_9AGAR|nr:hypothetical protein BDQ12DRAFT_677362 [Crucibulum laeve]
MRFYSGPSHTRRGASPQADRLPCSGIGYDMRMTYSGWLLDWQTNAMCFLCEGCQGCLVFCIHVLSLLHEDLRICYGNFLRVS